VEYCKFRTFRSNRPSTNDRYSETDGGVPGGDRQKLSFAKGTGISHLHVAIVELLDEGFVHQDLTGFAPFMPSYDSGLF